MKTLTPGLERLRNLIEQEEQKITVSRIARLVEQARVTEEDLLPYADFDHPREDGYGRIMAWEGDFYEIMVMSWNPGDFSAVHDHGHTTWGAVQVFGHVMHHTFAVKNGLFSLTRKEILPYGTIIKVNNPLIHQMGNVTTSPYLTLHIYGDYTHPGNVTADSRIFELETGLIKHTTGGAFFNLPDEAVYDVSPLPEVEPETFIHQVAVLLQYYQRYAPERQQSYCRNLLERMNFCYNS